MSYVPGSSRGGRCPRPEVELFQLTARSVLAPAASARLDDLLEGVIDWDYVLTAGGLHGILPLMEAHLAGRQEVPDAVRRELRARCERVARANLYMSSQLIDLAGALEAAGIRAVVLKGPAVANSLYGSLAIREFGDLDILVHKSDVGRATETIKALGFLPWREFEGAHQDLLRHVEYSRTFTRDDDDLDLDLHWDLARSHFRMRVEAEDLWDGITTFKLHGREMHCLSRDLLLLSLCVHGAKHGPFPWPRIKWICDVAEFARGSDSIDWESVLDRGRALGCLRALLLGLAVSRPLSDHGLPPLIERELRTRPGIEQLGDRVWHWLASDQPVSLSLREHVAVDTALIDSVGGRVSYGIRRILTPTGRDRGLPQLPRRFGFLYVPLRLIRLSGQYLPRPWRLRQLLRTQSPRDGEEDIPVDGSPERPDAWR